MNEPLGRFGTAKTISRGVDIAPDLGKGIAITFFLAVIGSLARVAVPILIQQSIDNGLEPGNVRVGYICGLGVIAAVAVVLTAWALRTAVLRLGISAEQGLYTIRVKLYDHIHRLSLADHNEERRGALVSRVTSDIETLTLFFSWGALVWLLDGSLMVVVACVMLSYDWILALVAFSVSAPLFFVLRSLQKRLVGAYDLARQNNADLLGAVSELVSGTETLRAYNAHGPMVARTKKAVKTRSESQVKAGIIGAYLFPSGEIFAVFTIVAIVVVGVLRGVGGGLSAGAMVGFLFLTYRFLEPIAEFTEVVDQTQTAVAGLRRVLSVLDTPVGPPAAINPVAIPDGPISIEFRDLSFAYSSRLDSQDDDLPVLRNISLVIPAQQHIALVGSSGSGKTTLARLISRLADPTIGSVLLSGVDLRDIDNNNLRQRLVVVPQEPFLFAETIAYNLLFARPDATQEDLNLAIDRLELTEWMNSLSMGLETHVGQRGSSLSAGERQLIALARASLTNPDVLVLDEATSALDTSTEVDVMSAINAIDRKFTVLMIAHRTTTLRGCDMIVEIRNGRLVKIYSGKEAVQFIEKT